MVYIRSSEGFQISESKIEAIYRCRANSMSSRDIARHLRINQHTVLRHLSGRYEYSPALARKLSRFEVARPVVADVPDGYLTLRQVSLLLPDGAGEWKIRRWIWQGLLKQTVIDNRPLYRIADVHRLIRSVYGQLPPGVGIIAKCLDLVLLDDPPPEFVRSMAALSIRGSGNYRGRSVYMLWDVERAARRFGLRFEIPAIVHSRVARRLSFGARFVLIHERFWA